MSQSAPADSPDPPRKFNWGRWAVLLAVVATVALFLAFGPDESTLIGRSAQWRTDARNHLFAAVALFFVAEVVLIGLSVPVGIWLTVLAGFLFGTWLGTAVVSCASTLGALLAFLSARYVFADALHRAAASRPKLARMLTRIDRGFEEHGAYYVVLLRMTPVFPFWVLNLGLGLTRVRLFSYWWASQLGMLPTTLVVANAGASLAQITSLRDVLSLKVLGALCLMPLVPFVLHHTAGRWLVKREKPSA
ncbi:MAG TPA: TVP38/TMEM64 family protein [Gemmataceae bacterium]|nr:TVP38/TMEM64 family protein [Gemmataceae bacterium]